MRQFRKMNTSLFKKEKKKKKKKKRVPNRTQAKFRKYHSCSWAFHSYPVPTRGPGPERAPGMHGTEGVFPNA